jgi:queuine tRNA-ribosyltransferase
VAKIGKLGMLQTMMLKWERVFNPCQEFLKTAARYHRKSGVRVSSTSSGRGKGSARAARVFFFSSKANDIDDTDTDDETRDMDMDRKSDDEEKERAQSQSRSFFEFTVMHESKKPGSRARVCRIKTKHGYIETPAFVAVGTQGALKAVSLDTLDRANLDLMFVNTYHSILQPGDAHIAKAGGIHKFIGRERPTISDSGGFQVFSLGLDEDELLNTNNNSRSNNNSNNNNNNNNNGTKELKSRGKTKHKTQNLLEKIDEDGVTFKSYRDGTTLKLTPESSVQAQKNIGCDIILPLDELTKYDISVEELAASVDRSHKWMTRSLEEHRKNVKEQAMYAIIHGGVDENLRKKSVEYLSSLPFDGYAIGGSLGKNREELKNLLEFLMPLIPRDKPNHLLGIGDLPSIANGVRLGVDSFDSAYPTQIARHGTLLSTKGLIHYRKSEYREHFGKPSEVLSDDSERQEDACKCSLCQKHTLSYLAHLDRANEPMAWTLATEHNLFFMGLQMEKYRRAIMNDEI